MFFAIRPRSISGTAPDNLSNRRADVATYPLRRSAVTIVCGEGSRSEGVRSAQTGAPRSNQMLPRG